LKHAAATQVEDDFDQNTLPEDQEQAPAQPKSPYSGVSAKTANRAKKGDTSSSRSGRAKQATYSFAKPNRRQYVKVHPSPAYSMNNIPVFINEDAGTFHFVDPTLYESGELPARFTEECKLIDLYVAGAANGDFFIWWVPVSASQWRKGALKAVEAAKHRFVNIRARKSVQSYTIEYATEAIPEPLWNSLPPLDQMLNDAFESTISVADDRVVLNYMSGGAASRYSDEEDGE
jgi:hypothetical protein